MRLAPALFSLSVASLILAVACSSKEENEGILLKPPGGTAELLSVDTIVNPTALRAGQLGSVRCVVTTGAGVEVKRSTQIIVSPPDGLFAEVNFLRAERVGEYAVACALASAASAFVDPSPALVVVTPGDPAQLRALPQATQLVVGESTTVDCEVQDAYGNPIIDADTAILSPAELPADGHTVSAAKPGDHEVECALADGTKVASIPATISVTAGDPVSLELLVAPDKGVYAIGEVVKVTWVAKDASGIPVPGVSATLQVPSAGLEDAGVSKWRFLEEGRYLFKATLLPPAPALSAERELLVDSSPPKLRILWPERGATVQGDGSPVVVEGTIEDAAGIKSFTIGGQPVTVDNQGAFSFPMEPRFGLNVIEAEAEDILGQSVRITPSFYYATSYLPYTDQANAVSVRLPNAATLALSQAAFDDGDHNPAAPNDLATWLTMALQLIDLNTLVPPLNLPPLSFNLPGAINLQLPGLFGGTTSIVGDLQVSIALGALKFGSPDVSLDCRDGGLDMTIATGSPGNPALVLPVITTLTAPVTATFTIPSLFGPPLQIPFNLVGTSVIEGGLGVQTGILYASIDGALEPGGTPILKVVEVLVDAQGIGAMPITSAILSFGSINLPLIGSIPLEIDLVQLAPQLFDLVNLLTLDFLWDFVEPLLSGSLTPLLSLALESIVQPLVDSLQFEVPLPLPLLTDPSQTVELALAVGPDTTLYTPDGAQYGLGVGIATAKGIDRKPLGLPIRGQCTTPGALPPLEPAYASGVELLGRIDTANALLFALWWSGAMHTPLDLGALGGAGGLPVDSLEIVPYFYLPPLISDCDPASNEIQVGDLFLDIKASVFGLKFGVSAFLDAALQAEMVADGGGWSMVLGEFRVLDLEVVEVSGGLGGLFDLKSVLENTLLPALTNSLPGTVLGPLALPALELDSLLPGLLPPGAAVNLGGWSTIRYPGRVSLGFDMQ